MWCFSWKGGPFAYKILFFWYFSDFHRLVQVKSTSTTNKKPSEGVGCPNCCNPGHVCQNCRKLHNKNRRFQFVHYQKSLKSTSTLITTLIESGKTNTCFISSSSTWVIDSGTTGHMAGNSNLFTTFQSHLSTFTVTLADRSTSCVLGSRTIHPTPLITLTSVLSLPQFSLFVSYNHLLSSSCSFIAFLDSISLPNTVRETLSYPD